jgi:dynein light intermediate chain 1
MSGVPIMVVCTKADLMDSAGDDAGMKGAAWEEKTDWIQQVLRTVCLSCKLSESSRQS